MVLSALLIEILFYITVVTTPLNLNGALILLVFGLLILWYSFLVPREYFKRLTAKIVNKTIADPNIESLLGEYHLQINENQILLQVDNSESVIDKTLIEKYLEGENYFLIYLKTDSVLIVPKNIFTNEKDQLKFDATIRNWL